MAAGPVSTLSVDELILDPPSYAEQRRDRREQAVALRRDRRVLVGDVVVVEFENAATLRYQAQEMLYVERVTDPSVAAEEIAVYQRLLPTAGTLTATMMVEIADQSLVREELARLDGIHEAVSLRIGPDRIAAREIPPPDEGPSPHTYTVHFLAFDLPAGAGDRLAGGEPAMLSIDHPAYQAQADLTPSLCALLARDIGVAAG